MATPAPAAFLRAGVDLLDTVAVPLPSGHTVQVRPARVSAADYLAGKASPYALAALRVRDAWVRASRTGEPLDRLDLVSVVLEALQDAYDAPPQEALDAWLEGVDAAAIHTIAAVALGATPTPAAREQGRARALVAGGLGSVPLSAVDAASLADWTVNAGRAPGWGG